MAVKKILSLAVVLAGVYFIGRQAAPDLGEVLDYAKANPQHQELIINRTMHSRERNNLTYSSETLGNFSRALFDEFSEERFKQAKKEAPVVKTSNTKSEITQFKKYLYDLVIANFENGL